MAQEIERARALLSALIRDKVLAADEATKSYEAWVSCGDESPFSRFVVDLFPQRGEALRAVLRLESVHGLPNPQAFTLERFEDLLVGQLGIEAGLLSPKLLQTVRAVQDKKVVEGKIRRLDDLLPRAGFDPKMVEMLYQHLRERVLICKGCLGRFPRQEMGAFAIECPRCDYNMLADALEPSGVTLLPSDQRDALMASSEAVLETVSVQDRLQRRADRGKKSNPTAILVVLFGLVAVIAVVIVVLLGRKKRGPVKVNKTKTQKTRKTQKTTNKTDGPDATPEGPKDGLSITEVRGQDLDLYKRGEFEELLGLWRQVKPQSGEDVGQVGRDRDARIERLEFLNRVAGEARGHLRQLGKAAGEAEEKLARLLGPTAVPRNVPPFDGAHERLKTLRDQRAKVQEDAARERYEEARKRVSSDSWARRLKRVEGKSLRGLPFQGKLTTLSVTDLDADGFTVKTADGETHKLEWGAEPLLSLALTKASTDANVAADQIELARHALIARDLKTAKSALAGIGASSISAEALIKEAPWSAVVLPSGKPGLSRVHYPTSFAPADFDAAPGSTIRAEDGVLALEGTPCRLETKPLPCGSPSRKSRKSPEDYVPPILVSAEFEEAVPGLTFGVRVVARGGTSKTYSVTWGGGEWRLELGRNLLQRGSLPPSGGRKVQLGFDGREISLIFDGLPVTTKATTARINEIGLLIAASETVRIRKVTVEAPLDLSRVARAEAVYTERVGREIDAIPVTGGGAEPFTFPVLTGEDPQAIATTTSKVIAALETAKAEILSGKVDAARERLKQLSTAEGKSYAPIWFYLAYVELYHHETALALRAAGEALSLDPRLVEARGLRALALARGLRLDTAEVEASAVLEVRPDQGLARLAQARIALAKVDLKEKPEGSLLEDRVRMAQALGPGDPLVVQDSRYLITLDRLYRQARVRKEDEFEVVLSRGSADDAARLSTLLSKVGTRLERMIRAYAEGPQIRVLIVPEDYGRLTNESGSQAYFSPELGVLLFPSVPKEETREIVSSLVAAHLAHRVGPAPAWLELGLREHFTWKLRKKRAESTLRLLKDNRTAPEADWLELLDGRRSVLLRQKLAWARCWALVEFAGRRIQVDLPNDVAAGEAIPVVPRALQLGSLPKDYLRWVKTQRLKR